VNVGGMNLDMEQVAENIHDDVALAPLHFSGPLPRPRVCYSD
jgi:hypothetical protein